MAGRDAALLNVWHVDHHPVYPSVYLVVYLGGIAGPWKGWNCGLFCLSGVRDR